VGHVSNRMADLRWWRSEASIDRRGIETPRSSERIDRQTRQCNTGGLVRVYRISYSNPQATGCSCTVRVGQYLLLSLPRRIPVRRQELGGRSDRRKAVGVSTTLNRSRSVRAFSAGG